MSNDTCERITFISRTNEPSEGDFHQQISLKNKARDT